MWLHLQTCRATSQYGHRHTHACTGMGERALELMATRALGRAAFQMPIAAHGGFQQQLARCRIELDAARLTVLDAANALDRVGNKRVRAWGARHGAAAEFGESGPSAGDYMAM